MNMFMILVYRHKYIFISLENIANILLSNESRGGGSSNGTSSHSKSTSRKNLQTDICGIIGIHVCLIVIDFVDPIIHEFKVTTNNE